MTTSRIATLAGPTARAMDMVQQQKKPGQEVTGRISCPRCGGGLRFNVQANGLSRGQCAARDCVRWCQ